MEHDDSVAPPTGLRADMAVYFDKAEQGRMELVAIRQNHETAVIMPLGRTGDPAGLRSISCPSRELLWTPVGWDDHACRRRSISRLSYVSMN